MAPDHIGHHAVTNLALGAPASSFDDHYNRNQSYQRPPESIDQDIIQNLHKPNVFFKYLDQERYYHDYVIFFQHEIDKHGLEKVVNEYVLKNDDRANALLIRIMCANDGWLGPYLLAIEKAAAANMEPSKSLADIIDQIAADPDLLGGAIWEEGNGARHGILGLVPEAIVRYASQWKVGIDELEYKTAEMTNNAGSYFRSVLNRNPTFHLLSICNGFHFTAFFAGAAQHPPKQIKFDFYYMHCVTSSICYTTFLRQPWITPANKRRLLQFKGWFDLGMYASRKAPKLLPNEIVDYKPKQPSGWDGIIERVIAHPDDGHASKLVRALKHGENICRPYEGDPKFRVKDGMWLQLGHMAIDSVQDSGKPWVRNAGFEEAWTDFEDRPTAQV
ncbi:MAG: hypothetical protein Q9224_002426 [Gallowayella concinna]